VKDWQEFLAVLFSSVVGFAFLLIGAAVLGALCFTASTLFSEGWHWAASVYY
jgi:hypothetical protein